MFNNLTKDEIRFLEDALLLLRRAGGNSLSSEYRKAWEELRNVVIALMEQQFKYE